MHCSQKKEKIEFQNKYADANMHAQWWKLSIPDLPFLAIKTDLVQQISIWILNHQHNKSKSVNQIK